MSLVVIPFAERLSVVRLDSSGISLERGISAGVSFGTSVGVSAGVLNGVSVGVAFKVSSFFPVQLTTKIMFNIISVVRHTINTSFLDIFFILVSPY
ncbi:MAG: hypothetical protein EWM47_05430 [Anaerolineaceae bacterium]|nr:MAG: hypothetical protein EWM47_05430 [Anaerolineaceae bacterium]